MEKRDSPPPPKTKKAWKNQMKEDRRKRKIMCNVQEETTQESIQIHEEANSIGDGWMEKALKIQPRRMKMAANLSLPKKLEEEKLNKTELARNRIIELADLSAAKRKKEPSSSLSAAAPAPKFIITPKKREKNDKISCSLSLLSEYDSDTE